MWCCKIDRNGENSSRIEMKNLIRMWLKEKKNILIIVDECHLANKIEHTLGKLFKDGNLKDPESLQQKNIKILQLF